MFPNGRKLFSPRRKRFIYNIYTYFIIQSAPKLRDLNAIRLSNWYRVGRNLLVPVYRLEAIRKKHHDDERAKLAMFGYWLKNAPHCANQYVVQALVDSNETRAADFYCLTHSMFPLVL